MTSLLHQRVEKLAGSPVVSESRLSGGNISGVLRMNLSDGRQIVAKRGAMVMTEADMLRDVGESGAPVPAIVGVEKGLLLLEYLQNDGMGSWQSLLAALDLLHSRLGDGYGWGVDYAFGRVSIPNLNGGNWPTFWAENRLLCHNRFVDTALAYRLDKLANRLGSILPANPPASLLHGDLWTGNILWNGGELLSLIDPACYFGDREVDYAMLALFDQPPKAFFKSAQLEPGWEERQAVYQLWPALVHLRLFGENYRVAVNNCLERLGG